MASKRLLAIQDLTTRLGFIQIDKGYSCDAGLTIFVGEVPKLGPDDSSSALAILLGDDSPLEGQVTWGATSRYVVPIEVHGILRLTQGESPGLAYEGLVADIKEAVEIEGRDPGTSAATDRSLGIIPDTDPPRPATLPTGLNRGGTRILRRDGGSEIVGCAVEYSMAIEEGWGQP